MKTELTIISDDLNHGIIDEEKARTLLLGLLGVSQQRELLLAYHKHLDSFNDPTIYNAAEGMIDDYLSKNTPQLTKKTNFKL